MDARILLTRSMCTVVQTGPDKREARHAPAFMPAAVRVRLVEPVPPLAMVRAVPSAFDPAKPDITFSMPDDGQARAIEVIDPDEGFFLRTPVTVWPASRRLLLSALFLYTDVPLSTLVATIKLSNPRFGLLPRAISVAVDVEVRPRLAAALRFAVYAEIGFRPVVNRSGAPGLIAARVHKVTLSGGGAGLVDRLTRGWLAGKVGAAIVAAVTPVLQSTLAATLTARNDPARHPIGFSRAVIAPAPDGGEPSLRIILSWLVSRNLALPDWTVLAP